MAYKTLRGGNRGLGGLGNAQGAPYSDLNGVGAIVFRGAPAPRPKPLIVSQDRYIPGPLTRTLWANAALTLHRPTVALVQRPSIYNAGVSGLPAAPGSVVTQAPAPAMIPGAVAGPPPDAMQITQGFAIDLKRGDMWVGVTKIAIVAAVLSAITVKVIMFGGNAGQNALRSAFRKKPATT